MRSRRLQDPLKYVFVLVYIKTRNFLIYLSYKCYFAWFVHKGRLESFPRCLHHRDIPVRNTSAPYNTDRNLLQFPKSLLTHVQGSINCCCGSIVVLECGICCLMEGISSKF